MTHGVLGLKGEILPLRSSDRLPTYLESVKAGWKWGLLFFLETEEVDDLDSNSTCLNVLT